METEKKLRIQKSAGITAKILKAIRIIIVVGACIAFAGGLIAFSVAANKGLWEKLEEKHIYPPFDQYDVNGFAFVDKFNIENPVVEAGVDCMVAAAACVIVAIGIHFIRTTFVVIENSETPFTKECLKNLRVSAILITILFAMNSLGEAAIVALTFWCLYCIFDYGIELQKSADETL